MSDKKQINFTIMPDEKGTEPRIYANFCAVAHTPFDFTLTFCEVMPLSEEDVRAAETERVVRAPVRVKIVVPIPFLSGLVTALQEQLRVLNESQPSPAWPKDPVH